MPPSQGPEFPLAPTNSTVSLPRLRRPDNSSLRNSKSCAPVGKTGRSEIRPIHTLLGPLEWTDDAPTEASRNRSPNRYRDVHPSPDRGYRRTQTRCSHTRGCSRRITTVESHPLHSSRQPVQRGALVRMTADPIDLSHTICSSPASIAEHSRSMIRMPRLDIPARQAAWSDCPHSSSAMILRANMSRTRGPRQRIVSPLDLRPLVRDLPLVIVDRDEQDPSHRNERLYVVYRLPHPSRVMQHAPGINDIERAKLREVGFIEHRAALDGPGIVAGTVAAFELAGAGHRLGIVVERVNSAPRLRAARLNSPLPEPISRKVLPSSRSIFSIERSDCSASAILSSLSTARNRDQFFPNSKRFPPRTSISY